MLRISASQAFQKINVPKASRTVAIGRSILHRGPQPAPAGRKSNNRARSCQTSMDRLRLPSAERPMTVLATKRIAQPVSRLMRQTRLQDVLPFGPLWYGYPNAIHNAFNYAAFFSRSRPEEIQVLDATGRESPRHARNRRFREPWFNTTGACEAQAAPHQLSRSYPGQQWCSFLVPALPLWPARKHSQVQTRFRLFA